MADIARCFKSGNTHRITLNRRLCYTLQVQRGDVLRIDAEDGTGTITNLSHDARVKQAKAKKK